MPSNRLNLKKRAANASLAAASTALGSMKRRIFNEGEAEEGRIGRYRSRSYRKKRQKAGRQVDYKDLEFEGDLRRSIQVGARDDGAVIGFTSVHSRRIAEYQETERQTGKDIFGLNENEIAKARRAFLREYRRTN
ncbi:hypothetical protein LEM8419_03546 [Neolewinella maritima]|uniref:Uncharacterized protein n=1 Tax=Neolewinella maritima TaxID=1383882 RepID=A0ABN8FB86_9BACT|nr:hypothetical protein [Neolewinella maritima]CAH1002674.1 hypothetical protein LEM8419_03546 [Neolewinella maritima]